MRCVVASLTVEAHPGLRHRGRLCILCQRAWVELRIRSGTWIRDFPRASATCHAVRAFIRVRRGHAARAMLTSILVKILLRCLATVFSLRNKIVAIPRLSVPLRHQGRHLALPE